MEKNEWILLVNVLIICMKSEIVKWCSELLLEWIRGGGLRGLLG